MSKAVGKINITCKHTHVQCEIENYFTSISQTVNTSVESPHFYFANRTWYLLITPNGRTDKKDEGWFCIYLMFKHGQKLFSVDCTVGILSRGYEKCSESFTVVFNANTAGWGSDYLIKGNELYEKREELVPGDTLTVFCRANLSSQKKDGINTLSEDLKNLFINEKNYDATIKVKDRCFKVHKVILGSRSPVLHAMFEHDMKEKSSSTVNIDDCEPEDFHDFLLFLYSEKIDILSPKNAASLYCLADKYLLESLTQACLNFMLVNINLDNVCEIVTLADRHDEEQLMETASEWIKNNLKDTVRTAKWVSFMAENTVLAAELLRKATE